MRRVVTPELLDSDLGTPKEISDSLADIHRINEWFGGVATSVSMVKHVTRVTGRRSFEFLESAAGSGDSARSMCKRVGRDGIQLRLTLLDRVGTHLPESGRAVVADALDLPFSDSAFDLIGCTLFAHHLGPSEVIRFVNEGLRVARIAVLINDLVRGPFELALAYATTPLHRSRLSRHDGIASVRQSYTLHEMDDLLHRTSAKKVEVCRRYAYRMAAIAWKEVSRG
jgi:hypothetical protein